MCNSAISHKKKRRKILLLYCIDNRVQIADKTICEVTKLYLRNFANIKFIINKDYKNYKTIDLL